MQTNSTQIPLELDEDLRRALVALSSRITELEEEVRALKANQNASTSED